MHRSQNNVNWNHVSFLKLNSIKGKKGRKQFYLKENNVIWNVWQVIVSHSLHPVSSSHSNGKIDISRSI